MDLFHRGKAIWMFDQVDMAKAKEIVGDTLCIFGNVPSTMLQLGRPESVKHYCKQLNDTAGKGGGFIMGNRAFFDHAKSEIVQAMVDFSKEDGRY
jgi:uroporphyrinogen-III decarboxylase